MIDIIAENIMYYIWATLYPDLYEIKTIERINSTETFIMYTSDSEE